MKLQSETQKALVQRIENALRTLTYNDAEVALILAQLDTMIQEEIGNEILKSLPQETQEQIATIVEKNGGNAKDIINLVPRLPQEELIQKVEEHLAKTAEQFEQAAADADTAEEKIKEYMQSKQQSVTPPSVPPPTPTG